jgi:hypothetical protein
MSCCGQKRAALRTRASAAVPSERAAASPLRPGRPGSEPGPELAVEYRGDRPVLVGGAATGRLYTFSPGRRTRSVSAADVPGLLLDPLFGPVPSPAQERSPHGTR